MKKTLFVIVSLLAITLACNSCRPNILKGDGKKVDATQQVTAFTDIEVNVPITISIMVQPGSQPGVVIHGYENITNHIKVRVEGNKLIISTDLDDTWTIDTDEDDDIVAKITVPTLTGLSLIGNPDAEIHGDFKTGSFELDVTGAGEVVIDNIVADSFFTDIAGAANLEIGGGNVKYCEYDVSGAAKINAYPLQAVNVEASISGAGKGELSAVQTLNVDISGAGSIKYKGNPVVTKKISGIGSVEQSNN